MFEQGKIEHSLVVEVRDKFGKIKSERCIEKGKEFIPNRFYIYLRNRGFIKSNQYKIPFLFGKTIKAR